MKYVLITGVNGGIGYATALTLVQQGYFVYGLDRFFDKEKLDHFIFHPIDIRDSSSIAKAYQAIAKDGIVLDAIIHLAGIYDLNSLVEMPEEDFIRIYDINVFGPYRINKTFLPLLQKGSKILHISSELGPLNPLPFTGIYGLSKSAIEKYAYSLRNELQLLGIQVVIVRPGAIDTGLLDISTKRIDDFKNNTVLYKENADRFQSITNKVESRKIAPQKLGRLIAKILKKKKARYVYNINRSPLLRLMSALPDHLQSYLLKRILTRK